MTNMRYGLKCKIQKLKGFHSLFRLLPDNNASREAHSPDCVVCRVSPYVRSACFEQAEQEEHDRDQDKEQH